MNIIGIELSPFVLGDIQRLIRVLQEIKKMEEIPYHLTFEGYRVVLKDFDEDGFNPKGAIISSNEFSVEVKL